MLLRKELEEFFLGDRSVGNLDDLQRHFRREMPVFDRAIEVLLAVIEPVRKQADVERGYELTIVVQAPLAKLGEASAQQFVKGVVLRERTGLLAVCARATVSRDHLDDPV